MMRSAIPAIGLVLLLAMTGCDDDVIDAGPLPTGDPASTDDASSGDDASTADPAPTGDPGDGPTATETPAGDTDEDGGTNGDDTETGDGPGTESGTGDSTSPGTSGSGNRTAGGDGTSTVRLYFMAPGGGTPARADPFLVSVQREIPSTPGVARAALTELVSGPAAADKGLIDGISNAVPGGTLILGINIAGGLATVDLSREFESGGGSLSMFGRLAQVVYTVTQFPTVDEVEFWLDGEPVTVFSGEGIVLDGPASRADFRRLLPTVFVDSPAAGSQVSGGRLRATGMAAVFEATFQYRLAAEDGTVLAEGFATTASGTGWSPFDITIRYDVDHRQQGTLTVWEYSAKDGSVQAERVTPLILAP